MNFYPKSMKHKQKGLLLIRENQLSIETEILVPGNLLFQQFSGKMDPAFNST